MSKDKDLIADIATAYLSKDEEEKINRISDEDVKRAALAYHLSDIMFSKSGDKYYIPRDNVYSIWGTNLEEVLPCLPNILTKTGTNQEEKKICDLEIFNSLRENALFLSEAVPYVKIYKTIIAKNPKNGKKEKIDINLPFDIVAGQLYGEREQLEEKILQGGSGGSVGITNFSWTSEGKNEGNNSLYTVNFKILLQDVAQLTKVRNQVGDHKVQILDLLYYGFLNTEKQKQDGDPEIQSSIEPDYLEFRAELGFNFSNFYKDYEKYFKTSLTLRVFKHNFNFNATGEVELEITAIGNIESDYSNKVKYNILENADTKVLTKTIKFFKKLQSSPNKDFAMREFEALQKTDITAYALALIYMSAFDDDFEQKAEAAIKQANINKGAATVGALAGGAALYGAGSALGATAATGWLAGLAKSAAGGAIGVGVFIIGSALVYGAVSIWDLYNETDEDKLNELYKVSLKGLKNDLKEAKINILNHMLYRYSSNLRYLSISKEQYRRIKLFMSIDEFTTLDKKILENASKAYPPRIRDVLGGEVIKGKIDNLVAVDRTTESYFSGEGLIGDVEIIEGEDLKRKRKIEEKDKNYKIFIPFYYLGDLLQAFIDQDEELKNNLNIYLGPFSFYDYKETFKQMKEKIDDSTKNNQNQYLFQNLNKKIGSISDIPIAVDTIIKWFKDMIESTEEQTYSFNNLLKFFMSDLIKQNISAKVSPACPYNTISINSYYFNTDKNYPKTKGYKASVGNLIYFNKFQKIYSKKLTTSLEPTGHMNNIAFMSVGETSLKEGSFKGDYAQDCQNNIMHLFVNSMSSIVKNISFSRDDDALLETANLQAANDANPNKIIRQVYQANISMFGNCIFEPGNLIYVKANYPGLPLTDNILEKIGLGGYYRIIEIANNITPSGFSTDLKCMWEMSSDGSATILGTQRNGVKIRVIKEP